MTASLSVLLVDDHALVRRGFRRMLEDEADLIVIGEASNGQEAVEMTEQLEPHVVVLDLRATRDQRRRGRPKMLAANRRKQPF